MEEGQTVYLSVEDRSRLFRKAVHFYSFLEDGELGLQKAILSRTNLSAMRANDILDEEDESLISPDEMTAFATVIGIPIETLIWNQFQMNKLYQHFNLDYDVQVGDINKRVLQNFINPLAFARAVMKTMFDDGLLEPKEHKYFDYLKRQFDLVDDIIIPDNDTSQHHFEKLIQNLPKDNRFISIVVKWIIGAVFSDGEVSPDEVQKLNELLEVIQKIRGTSFGDNLPLASSQVKE